MKIHREKYKTSKLKSRYKSWIDVNMFKIRDTTFIPYTEKQSFEGMFFYDLIVDHKPQLFIEIEPKVLDFKDWPICVSMTQFVTIWNTNPHQSLLVEAVYSESMTIEIKESPKNFVIEPGAKKTIKVMIVPEILGKEKHSIFFKLGDGNLIIYLVKVNGVKNRYEIEPIFYEPFIEGNSIPFFMKNTWEEMLFVELKDIMSWNE